MEGGLLVLRGAVERRVDVDFWAVFAIGLVEPLDAATFFVTFLGELRVGASGLKGDFLVLTSLRGDTGLVISASIWSIASSKASMASTESSIRLGGSGERVMILSRKESSVGWRALLLLSELGAGAETSWTTSLKSAILTGELLMGERE